MKTTADLDRHEIALLMWFCGMTGYQVRDENMWEEHYGCPLEELLDSAEAYADFRGVDVEEWERQNYGQVDEAYDYINTWYWKEEK